ncbi:MAG TPA: ATP-grasp domain-containing protein [Candidatus Acidoferrales bacterium]
MRLVEALGKELFKRVGLAVPRGRRARTPDEAAAAAEALGGTVVIKAQILAPGRGKKGGIVFADSPAKAREAAACLLGKVFGLETVCEVLVEEKLSIARELYAAVMIDPHRQDILFLASTCGGGDIEEVFRSSPEEVVRSNHSPLEPFLPFQGRKLARAMGLEGAAVAKVGQALFALYKAFRQYEARLLEINPLVLTEKGDVVAADAIVQIDEDAAFRLPVLKELGIEMEEERPRPPTPRELAAQQIDKRDYRGVVHYQDLYEDGTVGVVSVGSGFSLTLLDILSEYGLKPADFCDCSGSPPAAKVYEAVKLTLGIPDIKGFLFLSGVVTQDLTVTAEGIVKAFAELKPAIPFVVRLAGNRDREALAILKAGGVVESFPRETFVEECVERLKALMEAPVPARGS